MKKKAYLVYSRITGGEYLTERKNPSICKYRWCKDKKVASRLSYDAARSLASRWLGVVVPV